MRDVIAFSLIAAALLACPGPGHGAVAAIDNLCRLHGMGDRAEITKVNEAFDSAVSAGISEEELLPFLVDILKHKLDCGQMERILSSTTKLRRAGLPYFVVFSKVREGVSKDAPAALVVEAAESKVGILFASKDVLKSLQSLGYRVLDFQNAAVIVSSYLEKGYPPGEIVSRIRNKGVAGAGFAALSGVLDKRAKRK